MSPLSPKTMLRKALGFLHVGSMFSMLARSPFRRKRVFFIFEGREYSYGETFQQARRYAQLFINVRKEIISAGRMPSEQALAVGLYQENTPEFVFAFFGAAMSGAVLFGFNTGFRGDILAKIINQSRSAVLMTGAPHSKEIARILPELSSLEKERIYMVGDISGEGGNGFPPIAEALPELDGQESRPAKASIDNFSPLIVIYTSGTTGLPKGVPCSHAKCIGAGLLTRRRIGLKASDRGYVCMPLFHSNSILLGIMPILVCGGSFLLKRKFSASAFEEDILTHGVSYMNYVGQPIHYILSALENKYGSETAVISSLARHPRNRFRIAHGNGAPPVDRRKLVQYLGMEHIYELYGSTEAPITTVVKPGDPPDSVGRLTSKKIVILNEKDEVCPAGITDASGNLVNYGVAVGEIARKMNTDNIFFDGYFENKSATEKKFQGGYFRSGDLGHIRIINNKRFLFFNGRTDDWIRKDGENFSAENVALTSLKLPGVEQSAAFGVPSPVSDEKVMVALQLNQGLAFEPQKVFDWFAQQQQEGGMDPKWMPDYIRILDEFPVTQTHKILVRPLKQQHFHLENHPDMQIYFRRRGDSTYLPMTMEAFQETKTEFQKTGRLHLLEQN